MVPTLLALFWREGWGNSDYGAKKWKWRACIGVSHANVTGALADFGLGRISPKCVDGVVMSFHPNRVQNRALRWGPRSSSAALSVQRERSLKNQGSGALGQGLAVYLRANPLPDARNAARRFAAA